MTDRIRALTVVLKADMREDDVEPLRQAIALFGGVLRVDSHVSDVDSHVADMRARLYYQVKLLELLSNDGAMR